MSVNNKDSYESLVRFASGSAVFVAVVLVLSKVWAWWLSGSASMLASSTDSLLDVFASLTSFIILRYSLAPADDEHRFGHGKAENLAALMQASFVLGSAILLILHGVERTVSPQPVSHNFAAIMVSIVAILLTLGLVAIQRHVINKTRSIAISADSLHYQSDLLLNLGVIIALLLSQYGFIYADGAFAVLVGVFLGVGAIKISIRAVHDLMDHELSEQQVERITELIRVNEQSLGFHELRTRQSGKIAFIQFHLELKDDLTLYQAHSIADNIEQAIVKEFPNAQVLIHQDPQSVVKQELSGEQQR
ncbi:cation diffusion facilitator family transporter [Thalassotalea sp. HSM 43]|uniref:cation diffusion facilitator family transporter n=1 Tax=Thalassotalea sp. HSM 43 TaxID=2552945 RepID=UPI0010807114|nr:cation diffusion facilitator family transporter [Thalassotalea sp. HSM 43]QBY04617.1 cation diffusion facilitator family transporter [Thalassotalea sp. HSM 43]